MLLKVPHKLKTNRVEMIGKLFKPCSRGLFKSIEWLMQPTNIVLMFSINKALRLLHVDFFLDVTIEKCIVYI